jgi:hypothetical protein
MKHVLLFEQFLLENNTEQAIANTLIKLLSKYGKVASNAALFDNASNIQVQIELASAQGDDKTVDHFKKVLKDNPKKAEKYKQAAEAMLNQIETVKEKAPRDVKGLASMYVNEVSPAEVEHTVLYNKSSTYGVAASKDKKYAADAAKYKNELAIADAKYAKIKNEYENKVKEVIANIAK